MLSVYSAAKGSAAKDPWPALRGAAHDAVRQWCATNNHRPAGPNWEIYGHSQPEWIADPSRIRTDVYYLLADATSL